MTEDQYVNSILSKYAVNATEAQAAASVVVPTIQQLAGSQLANISYSGSFAKGTANNIGTDIDLFISLKSDTNENLQQIYESLYNRVSSQGWSARKQNVSIGITYGGLKIDLVPGRIQSGYQNVHSLYKRKTGSWTQTNVKTHIDTVSNSGRTAEIRAVKIWRDLRKLSFPSFYLELFVIDALKGKVKGNVAANVLSALSSIGDNITSKQFLDPANTNNIISNDLTVSEKTVLKIKASESANQKYWKDIIW